MSSTNKLSNRKIQDKHPSSLDKRKLNLVLQELLGLTMLPNREESSHESSTTNDSSPTSNGELLVIKDSDAITIENTTTTTHSNAEAPAFLNIHNYGVSESKCIIPSLKSSYNFIDKGHSFSINESALPESAFADAALPALEC